MYQITQGRLTAYLFVATLLVMVGMVWTDAPLHIATSPNGILSLEMAWTLEESQKMIQAWTPEQLNYAFFNVGFDYLFMLLYGTTLALLCWLAADTMQPSGMRNASNYLGYGMFLAAICDAIENTFLLFTMLGSANTLFPLLFSIFASIKFGLLVLGIVFILSTYSKIMLSMGFVFAKVLLGKK